MNITDLKPYKGARKKEKRIGCGYGSGHGKTSTRGMKGQRGRSGDGKQVGFEGGQMPLLRRIPKRGFNNDFRVEYAVLNVRDLERVFGKTKGPITLELLREKGLAKTGRPVKVLGEGELKAKLDVTANKFSDAAKAAIEKAGGKATVVEASKAPWQRTAENSSKKK